MKSIRILSSRDTKNWAFRKPDERKENKDRIKTFLIAKSRGKNVFSVGDTRYEGFDAVKTAAKEKGKTHVRLGGLMVKLAK